jgi:hypothetical protein
MMVRANSAEQRDFWLTLSCKELDLDEREKNQFSLTGGHYPLLATILEFPFPTTCLITGHVFGRAHLLSLARTNAMKLRRDVARLDARGL